MTVRQLSAPRPSGGTAAAGRLPWRRRRRPADPLLVAVSGPDGTGKSTLVRQAVSALRGQGYTVARTYCYGCVLCRRYPGRPRSLRNAGPVPRPERRIDALHARVDAAETALRLAVARLLTALRGRRPAVILSDRGPLDSLAKFDPPAGSRTAALFERLARAYDLTLLLGVDGDAPAAESDRDAPAAAAAESDRDAPAAAAAESDRDAPAAAEGDHDAPAAAAEGDRDGGRDPLAPYHRWASRHGDVVPFHRWDARPVAGADPALRLIAARADARRDSTPRHTIAPGQVHDRSPGAPRRGRVVVSIFDDADNTEYRGGGAVVIEQVARRLSRDHDVTVVTAARHGGTRTRDGVRYHFVPVGRAGPRAGQLLFQAALPFLARRVPHDVWLESFTPPFSTSFLPLFTRRPVIGIDQGRGSEVVWRKYHVPTFLVERLGLRLYRHLVVVNEADAADLRRAVPKAAVHLIENGVEVPDAAGIACGEGRYILYLGRLEMLTKGLDLLLAAYAKAGVDLPLYIAGHGTRAEERRVKALIEQTPGDVRWLGYVTGEDKRRLLAGSAFMVMPSRYEAFGLVALESMTYGKPVLHFALPWLRWMSGKGDVAVPAFDVDRLAEEIRRLATDPDLRRTLGRTARLAAERYTWEAMTARYLAVVREVLATAPAAKGTARPQGVPP
ncbi:MULTISPECIES: glycosyltransferase [unclassified Streptomyces]|uniref:glycosyltransferase n=1 Tax=unclassified Streptomyces TaxID=2593676 RepID=UPI0036FACA41